MLGEERIAISGVPTAASLAALLEAGITHAVNCRAPFQTAISQDAWALRTVLGRDRVALAPMWDHGRAQRPALWAPAARFGAAALDDPEARVLVHCQQGRRRSVLVAYAILRLRGMDPEAAQRLILDSRGVAHLVPAYRDSVERWLEHARGPLGAGDAGR